MDADSIPRSIITIVLLIFAGGFFAGTETAYSNCNHIRLKNWADDGKKSARRALRILEKFDKAIITLLIGNNVIHIMATSSAVLLAVRLLDEVSGPAVSTVVMTLLIFIFSETLPKNLGKARADEIACLISGPLWLLMLLLTPVDLIFIGLTNLCKRIFHSGDTGPSLTEDDFQSMIETIEDEGGLEAEESELIQSAVEFSDRTVSEVLTPRVHMVGLDLEDSDEHIFEQILAEKYSRMPVYSGDMDHIVGILNTKHYLQKKLEQPGIRPDLRELMTTPYVIRSDMGLHMLVEEMRRSRNHLAIVQDDWGGTEGMVTLEDLLEELVGEIWDEDEEGEK